jgi:hypothetical protein
MDDYKPTRFEDLSVEEWGNRFRAEIIKTLTAGDSEWTHAEAQDAAINEFEGLAEPVDMTESPEASAHESMSYWGDGE